MATIWIYVTDKGFHSMINKPIHGCRFGQKSKVSTLGNPIKSGIKFDDNIFSIED